MSRVPGCVRRFSSGRFSLSGVKGDGRTKRFYERVQVEPIDSPDTKGTFAINIDGHFVQTPRNKILLLPNKSVALAVAGEWSRQAKFIRPTSMPLTTLTTSAVDQYSHGEEREKILTKAKSFLETDLICFRSEKPKDLFMRQREKWDSVISFLQKRFSLSLRTTTELHLQQCPEAIAVLHGELRGLDCWRLAALDSVAGLARSYMLAIAYMYKQLTPTQLFNAARLEELFQTEKNGKVHGAHDIDDAYANVRFTAANTLLSLLQAE